MEGSDRVELFAAGGRGRLGGGGGVQKEESDRVGFFFHCWKEWEYIM